MPLTLFRINEANQPKESSLSEDTKAWNAQAYGMSREEMVRYLSSNLKTTFQPTLEETRTWLMTCMLSDAQELIGFDRKNEARQLINRVKFLANVELESYEEN